jgi:purine nucleosidase
MTSPASMQSLWIDTDMGFDDLAAVLTVAAQPGWHIAGMSLVAGNAPLAVVTDNALRAAHCFGWTFPIHAGCARPIAGPLVTAQNILGDDAMRSAGRQLPSARTPLASDDAVAALARHLQHAAQAVTVLALGPLTNLATLLARHPELVPRIGQLLWMGGSAGPGNHSAAAEFNAAVDPESVQQVLDHRIPLSMVGLDACRQVRVHATDADALRAVGGAHAPMLADLLLGYVQIASADGHLPMSLYDPTAAAALVTPGAMVFRPAHMVMELRGEHTRGMTVLEWRVPRRALPNVLVASSADETRLRSTVLRALAHAAGSP